MTTRYSIRLATRMWLVAGLAAVVFLTKPIAAHAAPPTECFADLNGDAATDVLDFGVFASNFGMTGLPAYTNGDLDGDGDVDVLDFGIFAGEFGCRAIVQFMRYEINDVGSLYPDEQPGDDVAVNATGLNEHGDVAGISEDAPWPFGHNRPFRYDYALDQMFPVGDETVSGGGKGINDNGVVVGWWMQPYPGGGSASVPFIAEPGLPIRSIFETYVGGEAWGINNSNQVCTRGKYFVDSDGTPTEIVLPGGTGAVTAWEINNAGIVTGDGVGPSGFQNCFRYDSATNTATLLERPFWRCSGGYGINDRGDISGWATHTDVGAGPAIIWTAEGDLIEFAVATFGPAYLSEYAEHVNMQGDVVGRAVSGAAEPPVGWVSFGAVRPEYVGLVTDPRRPKQFLLRDLTSPEDQLLWQQFQCFEINDARQITGIGVNSFGRSRAFLADPVPIIPGDLNLDGVVSSADMDVLMAHFGMVGARPLEGDMNRDRTVDSTDVGLLNDLISPQ